MSDRRQRWHIADGAQEGGCMDTDTQQQPEHSDPQTVLDQQLTDDLVNHIMQNALQSDNALQEQAQKNSGYVSEALDIMMAMQTAPTNTAQPQCPSLFCVGNTQLTNWNHTLEQLKDNAIQLQMNPAQKPKSKMWFTRI